MLTNMFIYIDFSIYIFKTYMCNQYMYIHMCKLCTCI